MKKKLLVVLSFCFLLYFLPFRAFAAEPETSVESILTEFESGQILKEKNAKEHRPIASMVKITSLLLTFENLRAGKLDPEEMVTISEHAAKMGGSQVFLDFGQSYRVKDLIKSVIVASANDSCVALAEHQCGSEEEFVAKMNEKVKALGLNDTVYTNCTGLPKAGQFSCAHDVAVLSRQLMQFPEYYDYSKIWTEDFVHPGGRITGMANTNKLIRFYEGCDGGKTGYTAEAKHCLSATAKRNGIRLIGVVIGAADSASRFEEMKSMFNYGFANYENETLLSDDVTNVKVKGAKTDTVKVKPEKPLVALVKKGERTSARVEIDLKPLKAPIAKGDVVGKAVVRDGERILSVVNLVALEKAEKATLWDYWKKVLGAN